MKNQYIHMRYYIVLFVIGSFFASTTLALLLLLIIDLKISGFILAQLLSFHVFLFGGIILNNRLFNKLKKETHSFIMEKQIHSSDQLNEFMKHFYNSELSDRKALINTIFDNQRPVELRSEKESAMSFYSRLSTNEKDILLNHYSKRLKSLIEQEEGESRLREKYEVIL